MDRSGSGLLKPGSGTLFFSFLYVEAIFSFISELITSWIRIQEASDYADPCGSGSTSKFYKDALSPDIQLVKHPAG